jgi:hypothetical protein
LEIGPFFNTFLPRLHFCELAFNAFAFTGAILPRQSPVKHAKVNILHAKQLV